jgi:chlorobactene glucosyltransferase
MIEIIIIIGLLIILFTVVLNVIFWPRVRSSQEPNKKVSVLIPARNEENNIIDCIQSVLNNNNITEILIYDDHSTDNTAQLVKEFSKKHHNITLIETKPLPDGWIGKNFACYQLGMHAKNEWLLFVDADTRLKENAVQNIIGDAILYNATMLSCWPGLKLNGFWEKLLMPMLNFFVFTVYPAPLSFVRNTPSLSIAHGACMLFYKKLYDEVDGHSAVRKNIFEDTEFARLWRTRGQKSICLDGIGTIEVRMYNSLSEIWTGFQKNFFPGFRRPISFWLFILFHFLLFLFPFIVGTLYLITSSGWSYFYNSIILIYIIRILLIVRFRQPIWAALLHPIAEIFLIALGISSWWKYKFGGGVNWKDRLYQPSEK